jgi:hypothetical protein
MVSSLMQNRFEFPTPPQATKRRAKNPPKYQLHTPVQHITHNSLDLLPAALF